MPPVPGDPNPPPLPRIVVYYQTHTKPDGSPISILPFIQQPDVSVTHIIVAAIHLNENHNAMTLNDHPHKAPRFTTLWAEMRIAQASGIKVMGMLGGAAKGTYARLDRHGDSNGGDASFEDYYRPLARMVRERGLDGLDLDVEEEFSLKGIIRLIDRLRADFGPDFIITLAPVAAALVSKPHNLSGFDYEALEVMRGRDIAWYNAQFYCGWGDASNPNLYQACVAAGWPPEKLVMGLVTNPDNGSGFVPFDQLRPVLVGLRRQYHPNFGGVMGWEYFNSRPFGREKPWGWAQRMTKFLRSPLPLPPPPPPGQGHSSSANTTTTTTGRGGGGGGGMKRQGGKKANNASLEADPDPQKGPDTKAPRAFEYYSDGAADDA